MCSDLGHMLLLHKKMFPKEEIKGQKGHERGGLEIDKFAGVIVQRTGTGAI